MSEITSLTELLRNSGAQLRFFDMGRRISKLSTEQFAKIENQQIPYPLPYLHHAWLALMLWNPKDKAQGVVWFLKLPLDEQGFLVQAVRDDLLNRLLQNASNLLNSGGDTDTPDALKDNPFSFKPDQEKMAVFHAYSTLVTAEPPSSFYRPAQNYFSGADGFSDWQSLGFQGIADLVVRHQQESNSAMLTKAIPFLPDVPFEALCTCLENIEPEHGLYEALCTRAEQTLQRGQANSNHIAALIRGLSNGRDQGRKLSLLQQIVGSDYALEPEVIAAIATRCTESLQHPELLQPFLEKLAAGKAGQTGFSRILSDLMFLPALRALILMQFRGQQRSETLSQAIGEMFGQSFTTH
ncbi:DUF3549 family protein [Neptuniibacter sp. CAU 1671]|uniref:DUF3549 family protein n=1 Tax=Neptuniibacter sp. CAU 1671 TaxID=3032593 RepID=UPI0023DC5AB9|nr:DUF3549 family protein [Neptuniibacter sp. CAU 1671]MDF2182136.1 DUF3549 family protein [Neptuniibacter sp. CAU 1671]